jgi:uncharacterized protein (TIGR02284 family)
MRNRPPPQRYEDGDRPAAIAALCSLIDVCRDGQRGYSYAAEVVEDRWLQQLFWDYAKQRASFADSLERAVLRLGGRVEPHPSVSGWIHRKWLDVRATLGAANAVAMLVECERGENAARVKYEHALSVPLPDNVQELLLAQLTLIQEAHDRLDRMRGGSLTVKSTSG